MKQNSCKIHCCLDNICLFCNEMFVLDIESILLIYINNIIDPSFIKLKFFSSNNRHVENSLLTTKKDIVYIVVCHT